MMWRKRKQEHKHWSTMDELAKLSALAGYMELRCSGCGEMYIAVADPKRFPLGAVRREPQRRQRARSE